VVAHVEISSYPFHITLWDIRAMLPEVVQSHILPFGSLIMQSYPQMQSYLMDQLHEQEFISLLANAPSDVV